MYFAVPSEAPLWFSELTVFPAGQAQLNVEDQAKQKEKTGFTAGLSQAKGGYDYASRGSKS